MILSVQDREILLKELTEEQRYFLSEQMVRGRRTVFANEMAKEKGYHIPENAEPEVIELLLDDWLYTGYTDAGAVTPELRCECGRPLRYQHHVTHKVTGEVKMFGIEHLKEHLGIDARIVTAIKQGFDAIDYELDEILIKKRSGWKPEPDLLGSVQGPLPEHIRKHLELQLPLLEKQLKKLRQSRNRDRQPSSLPRPFPSAPPAVKADVPRETKEQVEDLFTWLEEQEEQPAIEAEPQYEACVSGELLSPALHQAVKRYIDSDVRSARVICELLIREHGASETRFATGKPVIYLPVCLYIERTYPDAQVERQFQEDRYYTV